MIKEFGAKKPVIHGLLLLDCWEPQVYEHLFKDKFYIDIIEKIKSTQYTWIVNSASRLQIELNDVAMTNTIKLCQYQDDHPIIKNLLQQAGTEKTSTLISKYLFNKHTVNIINENDFVWFCIDYLKNQMTNWLVIGHTWQMCTHTHALGLHYLAGITKRHPLLNFYATDYSFCKLTGNTATLEDFEQDSMNWCLIEDFGYRLLPQGILDKY
jgi:hypothetical protein